MKAIHWVTAGIAALTLALLAGCSASGQPPQTVNLTAQNLTYGTKSITVTRGTPVKLVFQNSDSQLHDFSIDKIPAKVKEEHSDMHDMGGKKPDVHVSVDAGKSGEVQFTPTEKGTYTFYCTVAGHKDAGMQGTLIVQ
ncbi:MAG TPA: cupredoxin domain-containing protein [Symbiobacteriaceae bacterium]